MSDERMPQRRIPGHIVIVPSVQDLASDALSVIATEILKFKVKAAKPDGLQLTEARILQGYVKSLVELSREAREHEATRDLANLSNDELLALVDSIKQKSNSGSNSAK